MYAGWLRYLLAIDDAGNQFALSPDPLLDQLLPKIKDIEFGKQNDHTGILEILSDSSIFGVSLVETGLADLVCQYFDEMVSSTGAIRETLKKYVG